MPGLANRNDNQNVTNANIDNNNNNSDENNNANNGNDSNNNNSNNDSNNKNNNQNNNNNNNNSGGCRRGGRQFLTIMEEEGEAYVKQHFSFHTRGAINDNQSNSRSPQHQGEIQMRNLRRYSFLFGGRNKCLL